MGSAGSSCARARARKKKEEKVDVGTLIQTKDVEGCWTGTCFPCVFCLCCYKKEATGPDSLKHTGICFPCFIIIDEHRDRVPGTSSFVKKDDKKSVETYSSSFFTKPGPCCATLRLC